MGKILRISLKLILFPNTLGCYGLKLERLVSRSLATLSEVLFASLH